MLLTKASGALTTVHCDLRSLELKRKREFKQCRRIFGKKCNRLLTFLATHCSQDEQGHRRQVAVAD